MVVETSFVLVTVIMAVSTVQAAPNNCSAQYQTALQEVLKLKKICKDAVYKDCCEATDAVKFACELVGSTPPDSGIYDINHVCGAIAHTFHTSIPTLQARCNNGGWTVILRRKSDVSQRVNFTRTWNEYKHGFGDLDTEFWYGLRNIHCLTKSQRVDLQILLHYTNGSEHTFTYGHFVVDGPEDKFTLHIGQLQQPSPGRDAMAYINGSPFTTYDSDNDNRSVGNSNCALSSAIATHGHGGGWWYKDCSWSVITPPHPNIYWYGRGINYVEMRVRPK